MAGQVSHRAGRCPGVFGSMHQDVLHPDSVLSPEMQHELQLITSAVLHLHGQKCTGSEAGQRAGRGKRRGESFVETTNILASLRKKSKQSLVKRSHPGTFQARKDVGTAVSGSRQVCPAWGLPRQAALLNRALYGPHLPTWCSRAPALRDMGKIFISIAPTSPLTGF